MDALLHEAHTQMTRCQAVSRDVDPKDRADSPCSSPLSQMYFDGSAVWVKGQPQDYSWGRQGDEAATA